MWQGMLPSAGPPQTVTSLRLSDLQQSVLAMQMRLGSFDERVGNAVGEIKAALQSQNSDIKRLDQQQGELRNAIQGLSQLEKDRTLEMQRLVWQCQGSIREDLRVMRDRQDWIAQQVAESSRAASAFYSAARKTLSHTEDSVDNEKEGERAQPDDQVSLQHDVFEEAKPSDSTDAVKSSPTPPPGPPPLPSTGGPSADVSTGLPPAAEEVDKQAVRDAGQGEAKHDVAPGQELALVLYTPSRSAEICSGLLASLAASLKPKWDIDVDIAFEQDAVVGISVSLHGDEYAVAAVNDTATATVMEFVTAQGVEKRFELESELMVEQSSKRPWSMDVLRKMGSHVCSWERRKGRHRAA